MNIQQTPPIAGHHSTPCSYKNTRSTRQRMSALCPGRSDAACRALHLCTSLPPLETRFAPWVCSAREFSWAFFPRLSAAATAISPARSRRSLQIIEWGPPSAYGTWGNTMRSLLYCRIASREDALILCLAVVFIVVNSPFPSQCGHRGRR